MIVCLCHAVSDRTLQAEAAAGRTLAEIATSTGVGSDCGACAETVARLVSQPGPCQGEPCDACPRQAAVGGASRAA
jgi:bacterioferritin-associated ferredoxin